MNFDTQIRWLLGVLCCAFVLGTASVAVADRTGQQARRLTSSRAYKIRLSAALALSNSRDPRAVSALSDAVQNDASSTIRRVAAAALGRVIDRNTPASVRVVATRALKAASYDKSRRVRRNASKSLRRIKRLPPARGAERARYARGSVFIHVGMPSDRTRGLPGRAKADLQRAVERALRSRAPKYRIATNQRSLPTKSQLAASRALGFYVGAQVARLDVRRMGNKAEIRCSVSVRVSPWEGRGGAERMVADRSASASGSARVVGPASRRGISGSKADCVVAVAEEITRRQVVPFLKRAAR